MRKSYDSYWKRLDNVATLYASTTTTYNPNNNRLSVKLKEKIDNEILKTALYNTLQIIPTFNVKLRKGFFWYYFEQNEAKPIIKEDRYFPFTTLNNFNNNYFLFSVTYYEKRINLDFSHILTDGTGAFDFLITLVTNYLKLKHPKKVKQNIIVGPELVSPKEMAVDSFFKYANMKIENKKTIRTSNKKAYHITGDKTKRENTNVIIGTISVEQLKKITKAKGVSVTVYLAAVLIYAIYNGNYKYTNSKDPIILCIPVDLRQFFPSHSMNNFFATITVSIDHTKEDYTFDDILNIVSTKMKKELDKVVLYDKFRLFTNLQHNLILRFIPLVIKNVLLRGVTDILASRGATTTLSNLGIIKVNDEIKEFIDKFDVIAYTYDLMPLKIGICTFGDKLSISFALTLFDTEIERQFFTYLTGEGLNVKITTSINDEEDEDK